MTKYWISNLDQKQMLPRKLADINAKISSAIEKQNETDDENRKAMYARMITILEDQAAAVEKRLAKLG